MTTFGIQQIGLQKLMGVLLCHVAGVPFTLQGDVMQLVTLG